MLSGDAALQATYAFAEHLGLEAVTAGEVPREAAIEIVLASVPSLSREQATRMIGPEDFKATPKPVPPAFGAPAAPPPAKPEEPAPDPTAPR